MQLPSQKEFAAGAGGIIAFLIIIGARWAGFPLGDTIEGGLIVIVPAVLAKVVPPSEQDVLRHINDTIAQAGTILGKLTPASDSTRPPTLAAADLAAKVS